MSENFAQMHNDFLDPEKNGIEPPEEAEDIVNNSNDTCVTCGQPSARICTHCGQEFCTLHFCPMHEVATKVEPLTDEDGTKHEGRRIRLIGEGWPNALKTLDDMSDDELREHLAGMQKLLEQAIQTGNYASISIAAIEYKLSYREHSRYVAAVKRREKLVEQGQIRLGNKKIKMGAKAQIPADIAAIMKLSPGMTFEQAVAMKAILAAAKKA